MHQSASEAMPHRVKCSTAAEAYANTWDYRLSSPRTFFKKFCAPRDHQCPYPGSNVISTDEERFLVSMRIYGVSFTNTEPAKVFK